MIVYLSFSFSFFKAFQQQGEFGCRALLPLMGNFEIFVDFSHFSLAKLGKYLTNFAKYAILFYKPKHFLSLNF